MDKEPEAPRVGGVIEENRRKFFACSVVVAVVAAWSVSTVALVLWELGFPCFHTIANVDKTARPILSAAYVFLVIGVIAAFPLEIAVVFVALRKPVWVKVVVAIFVLLGMALAVWKGFIIWGSPDW